MRLSYAPTAFPDSADSSGGPCIEPHAWVPMEPAAVSYAALTAARGALLMLTLTMWLIGVAMVVGSVVLLGLCGLQEPPRQGPPPVAPGESP